MSTRQIIGDSIRQVTTWIKRNVTSLWNWITSKVGEFTVVFCAILAGLFWDGEFWSSPTAAWSKPVSLAAVCGALTTIAIIVLTKLAKTSPSHSIVTASETREKAVASPSNWIERAKDLGLWALIGVVAVMWLTGRVVEKRVDALNSELQKLDSDLYAIRDRADVVRAVLNLVELHNMQPDEVERILTQLSKTPNDVRVLLDKTERLERSSVVAWGQFDKETNNVAGFDPKGPIRAVNRSNDAGDITFELHVNREDVCLSATGYQAQISKIEQSKTDNGVLLVQVSFDPRQKESNARHVGLIAIGVEEAPSKSTDVSPQEPSSQ